MTNLKNLLSVTDFSRQAAHAAHRAALIAAQHQARLELLHVMSGSAMRELHKFFGISASSEAQLIEDASRQLAQLRDEISGIAGSTPETLIRVGSVTEEIMSAMAQADLLVLGAHGMSSLRDLTIGTLAERLLGKSTLPTLVVNQASVHAYKKVLVPVDFSAHSAVALQWATQIAPEAEITLTHAFEVPFESKLALAGVGPGEIQQYRLAAQQQAIRNIRELVSSVGKENRQFPSLVEHGDASYLIQEQAEDLGVDLIVIGKHGQSVMEELLLGSVTRHVLAKVKCDVLVVHA